MIFEKYDRSDMDEICKDIDEIRKMFAERRRWIMGMVVTAILGYVAMVIAVVGGG